MTAFVVKMHNAYVAFPKEHSYRRTDESEWTNEQQYAWRWVGLESGNGARLTARRIGNGARVVKLVPKAAESESPDRGDAP